VLAVVVLMLVLGMSVGMAKEANWVLVSERNDYNSHFKQTFHFIDYLDTNSINKVQIGINEVIKSKIKTVYPSPEEYAINQYWVNGDTKQWKLAFSEKYINGKLDNQLDARDQSWNDYDPNNKIVNAILERAN
jgi:hypothetical protein